MQNPPLPVATRIDLLRWLLRRLRRVRVVGASMAPTLIDGDVVLVDTGSAARVPHDLDIVVARHPQQPELEIVKRVEFVESDGVYLRSDNHGDPNSVDSRRFGIVPFDHLVGRVISKLERDEAH